MGHKRFSAPQKVAEYADPDAIVHNLYIKDNLAYVAYYNSGFRIFDVSDPTQINLVDEFDTSQFTGEAFHGAFGAYPFAPSGNIYVSDVSSGLHIFSLLNTTENSTNPLVP